MSAIYHVLNRGVDKRKIFMEDKDYLRFIHDLFEFNDENPVNNNYYKFHKHNTIAVPRIERKPRQLLVDIYVFCLMPNHYHLLLSPRRDGGISRFMKKLNMGYARYFNEKYNRSGTLFEGRFKSVLIERQAHFIHLPYYIHFNPLDFIMPEWRDRKIEDYKKAINFLNSYRWSSHLDYLGQTNFPSVTKREFLLEIFGGQEGYQEALNGWLIDLRKVNKDKIKDMLLES